MYLEEAIIEIPLKTKNKYEVDKTNGKIKLNRVLYSAMSYPAEYGYIDETLELDGDPLDILVISSEQSFPGCVIPVKIIGNLVISDNGQPDNKIISVVAVDPRYEEVNDLSDVSEFVKEEIQNFFENYKTLQGIEVEVGEYQDKDEAMKVIAECKERYKKELQK